jgi:hypothetical protein
LGREDLYNAGQWEPELGQAKPKGEDERFYVHLNGLCDLFEVRPLRFSFIHKIGVYERKMFM